MISSFHWVSLGSTSPLSSVVPVGDDVVEYLSVGLVESGVGFSVVEPLPGFDGVVVGVFPPQLVNIKGSKRIENKVLLLNFII